MTVPERVHGSLQADEAARFGRDRADFLDFSANLNPYGPPSAALIAAARSDLSRYPDPACTALRQALARKLAVGTDNLLAGNGSSELFHLLARACLQPGDRALVFAPAFGEYAVAARAAGAIVEEARAGADDGFVWDVEAALARIEAARPALAFLGLPNNPTGAYLPEPAVRRLAAAIAPGLLVLDEAYISFVGMPWRSLLLAPNLVVVRSLTKDFALPGLRIGYLVAAPAVVARAAAQQPSWSVSAPAQDAALACLAEDAWLAETVARVHEAKQALVTALRGAGFEVVADDANFVLIRTGDGAATRRRLLEAGIAVRDCASFGLPQYIRAGVRPPADCERLVAALTEAAR